MQQPRGANGDFDRDLLPLSAELQAPLGQNGLYVGLARAGRQQAEQGERDE
ncbi:MAG: hypothetical protein ACREUT_12615 [Steroidobacteraceae bacterium]